MAGLVRLALEQGKPLSELTPEELAEQLAAARRRVLRAARATARGSSPSAREGGTSLERVREQLERARGALASRGSRDEAPAASTPARCSRWRGTLIGCVVSHGGCAGVIVETEAYHDSEPACHAFVGLTPRTRDAVRAAGRGLRLPLLRHPRVLNAVVRARGRRRGGADPRARAARGDRADARARAASSGSSELCSGPGQADAGARHRARATTAPTCARPDRDLRAARGVARGRGRREPADRDHQGAPSCRGASARRQPVPVAARRSRSGSSRAGPRARLQPIRSGTAAGPAGSAPPRADPPLRPPPVAAAASPPVRRQCRPALPCRRRSRAPVRAAGGGRLSPPPAGVVGRCRRLWRGRCRRGLRVGGRRRGRGRRRRSGRGDRGRRGASGRRGRRDGRSWSAARDLLRAGSRWARI